MELTQLLNLIGEPVEKVKRELESKGYSVTIREFSKPKMTTDTQLVVKADKLTDNHIELIVGDFLTNL